MSRGTYIGKPIGVAPSRRHSENFVVDPKNPNDVKSGFRVSNENTIFSSNTDILSQKISPVNHISIGVSPNTYFEFFRDNTLRIETSNNQLTIPKPVFVDASVLASSLTSTDLTNQIFFRDSLNLSIDTDSSITVQSLFRSNINTSVSTDSSITVQSLFRGDVDSSVKINSNLTNQIFFRDSLNLSVSVDPSITVQSLFRSDVDTSVYVDPSITVQSLFRSSVSVKASTNTSLDTEILFRANLQASNSVADVTINSDITNEILLRHGPVDPCVINPEFQTANAFTVFTEDILNQEIECVDDIEIGKSPYYGGKAIGVITDVGLTRPVFVDANVSVSSLTSTDLTNQIFFRDSLNLSVSTDSFITVQSLFRSNINTSVSVDPSITVQSLFRSDVDSSIQINSDLTNQITAASNVTSDTTVNSDITTQVLLKGNLDNKVIDNVDFTIYPSANLVSNVQVSSNVDVRFSTPASFKSDIVIDLNSNVDFTRIIPPEGVFPEEDAETTASDLPRSLIREWFNHNLTVSSANSTTTIYDIRIKVNPKDENVMVTNNFTTTSANVYGYYSVKQFDDYEYKYTRRKDNKEFKVDTSTDLPKTTGDAIRKGEKVKLRSNNQQKNSTIVDLYSIEPDLNTQFIAEFTVIANTSYGIMEETYTKVIRNDWDYAMKDVIRRDVNGEDIPNYRDIKVKRIA